MKKSCYLYNCHHHFKVWVFADQSTLIYVFANTPGATPASLLYINYALKKLFRIYSKDQCMSPLASELLLSHELQDPRWPLEGTGPARKSKAGHMSKPGSGQHYSSSTVFVAESLKLLNSCSFWSLMNCEKRGRLLILPELFLPLHFFLLLEKRPSFHNIIGPVFFLHLNSPELSASLGFPSGSSSSS